MFDHAFEETERNRNNKTRLLRRIDRKVFAGE